MLVVKFQKEAEHKYINELINMVIALPIEVMGLQYVIISKID